MKIAKGLNQADEGGVLHKAFGGPVQRPMVGMGGPPQPMSGAPSTVQPMAPLIQGMDRRLIGSGQGLDRLMARRAEGGKIGVTVTAMRAIKDAIEHLNNGDPSSAKQTLQSSREALSAPEVKSAVGDLAYGRLGVKKAVQKLQSLVESFSDTEEVPMMKARGGKVRGD